MQDDPLYITHEVSPIHTDICYFKVINTDLIKIFPLNDILGDILVIIYTKLFLVKRPLLADEDALKLPVLYCLHKGEQFRLSIAYNQKDILLPFDTT